MTALDNEAAPAIAASPQPPEQATALIVFGMTPAGEPTSIICRRRREDEPTPTIIIAKGRDWVPDRPIHLGHPAPDDPDQFA